MFVLVQGQTRIFSLHKDNFYGDFNTMIVVSPNMKFRPSYIVDICQQFMSLWCYQYQ